MRTSTLATFELVTTVPETRCPPAKPVAGIPRSTISGGASGLSLGTRIGVGVGDGVGDGAAVLGAGAEEAVVADAGRGERVALGRALATEAGAAVAIGEWASCPGNEQAVSRIRGSAR